mgnify:FL=1
MADDGDPGAGVRAVQLLDAVCNAQKGAVGALIAHLGQVIADIGQHDAVKDDGPAHEEDGPAPERGSARREIVQPLVEQHEAQIKGGVAHGHQVVVIDPGVEETEGRGPQRQCGQIDEQEPKADRVVPKGLLYEDGQQENGQQGKDQNVEHEPDREAVVQVKEEAEEAGDAAMQSRPEMEKTDGVEALIVGQGGAGKGQNQLQGHSIDRSGQHTACQKPPRTAEGRGSAAAVKDTIELLNKLYQLRTCNRVLPRDIGIERPCLNYHIRQCLAPCQGYVSKEEYRQQVAGALEFLNGNYSPILKDLEEKMKKAAEAMEFEDAARYRDLLSSVRQVSQKQKITEGVGEDKDILALYQDETEAVVQVFFVRDGKLIGREHYYMTHVPENNKPAILQDFVKQFYAGTPFIPRELMLQYEIEDAELIEKWLSERKGSRVYLKVPKIGSKEKLVELAAQNAKLVLSQDREKLKREEGRTIGAVKEISDLLQLPLTGTARMEAYDISNINGFENVGSMVVYEKGKPKRSDYRKFKIKSVSGPDDYACMREVLTRRFRHGMEESRELEEQEMDQEYGSFTKFPDLILMDGGRGQVNIALSVLEELGIDIPVCGMVKDDNHRTRGLYYHNIELPIDTHSEGFKLITRIQDEAHRFAIEYHRSLRSKTQVRSVLDDIPGVGPTRRKALMRHFKSLEEIRQATVEDLMEIPEMNERTAQEIVAFFASQKRPPVVQS